MGIRSPTFSVPYRSPCYNSAVAIMFLLSLWTFKYLLPQCCFIMVSDCSCRPTSASQVYIYIDVSMRFITVSMHLQVTGATVPCQLVFFLLIYTKSFLPQSCVNKVDYCLYALANHCWHSSVLIKRLSAHLHRSTSHCYHEIGKYMSTKKSAKIWQNNCHNCCRWNKFA